MRRPGYESMILVRQETSEPQGFRRAFGAPE